MLNDMFFALLDNTAAQTIFSKMLAPVIELLNAVTGPAIGLVAAIGSVYCILLGVKLAKAEEPQEHQKAKNALKNAIIGFALIFVLIAGLRLSIGPLTTWLSGYSMTVDSQGNAIS